MCDIGTKYMLNAIPYIGKATNTNGLPLREYFMKELTRPIHGSKCNLTCDNWFTSVLLAKSFLREPYKLTLVGTRRLNKREIPEEMKNTCSRPGGPSMFGYDGCLTLVSYKTKLSKMVYLPYSCDEGVLNPKTGKPEMIMYYNQTKEYMKIPSTKRTTPWMIKRLEAPTLPKHARDNILNIFPQRNHDALETTGNEPPAKKRRYCDYCTSKKRRCRK
ncbi:hypothetical protein EVAR_32128_1 [Eumeta japonica]|uniref:PiggyBac transposable element-derived protein domain-containing protein n=1 Tax=Eumeta variegata TaxID=151549 RepID=A0A4C1V551_EUMVA|nr:hypothetical protein EVAR_32128_1 [Eumeta japonica]